MSTFFLAVIAAICGAVGDVLINQWAKTQNYLWWGASIPFWVAAATVFGFLLQQKHYSFSVSLIAILVIHSGIVLVWDVLVERALISPIQWVGVAAALLAIVLMEVGRK